jgi:hypothetical protein
MSAKKVSTKSKPKSKAKESFKREPKTGGQEDADITMRALSIRQPWAEQIMRGEKVIEFRGKPTNIRDTVYLYASLGRYPKLDELEIIDEVGFEIDELPRGFIVGTVEIADCEELGNGQYGWTLKKPKRLKKLLKPTQQPNPTWFYPFVSPTKS